MEDATKDATIFTLFRSSEVVTGVEAIEVNPTNGNFSEDSGPLVAMNSIIPKLTINMKVTMTKSATETDKLRAVKFKWMPIYSAFLDSLEAEDTKTAVQIEDILELQHDTTNKDTYPLFSTTKLSIGPQPMSDINSTEVFGDYGLTTNSTLESVAFDEELLWDSLKYYTNAAKLRKQIGKVHAVTITRDRPYEYFSNNFTYPAVKRANPYTFCGILMWVPQVGSIGQFQTAGETSAVDHLYVNMSVRFSEWNADHDQTAY